VTGTAGATIKGLNHFAPIRRPGHVAILGAGPIGLDAALACLDNGGPCTTYESAASVAANVNAWRHIRLFTPWSMNISTRMDAHLRAAGVKPPGPAEHCPTGAEFVEQLLRPLAELPELADVIRNRTRVLAVARQGLLKHEEIGSTQRGFAALPIAAARPRRRDPGLGQGLR
jgi:NADPH-dependent 2,4-dienoyl-CoA reductase/sulfur reductase-like enzyme